MQGVLLFGGSFDPIHNGHVTVCRCVADRLAVERIILIPAANPPHKRGRTLATAEHRLAMCRLAAAGDLRFEISDWEMQQTGPSYTLLTVSHFRDEYPDRPLYWLIGMDSLAELATWYRIGDLASICTIVTARRPGVATADLAALARLVTPQQLKNIRDHIIDTPLVAASATDVRARVALGQSVDHLVPPAVADYIRFHRLYAMS